MSILSEKNSVANDKEYKFTITIGEARRFGMPAYGILEMILANRAKYYPVIFPNRRQWAELTGMSRVSLRVTLSQFLKKGILSIVETEEGQKVYKYNRNGSLQNVNEPLQNVNEPLMVCNQSLQNVNEPLHQSVMNHYTNVNEPLQSHYISEKYYQSTKELKEEEEGLSPQVGFASSCVSDFSSPVVIPDEIQELITNPPFVSVVAKNATTEVAETDFGNPPQTVTAFGVTYTISKPVNASGSTNGTTGHSDTSVGMVQEQEGGKMEATQGREVAITKPKSNKPKKAKSYTQYAEQDFFWPDHWTGRGRQALQTWVEYKRDTGKAVLLQSYQQLIKNFIGDEPGFVLAVDHSIANAYQGLFKPNGQQLREAQKQQQQAQVNSTDWHDRLAELLAMEE